MKPIRKSVDGKSAKDISQLRLTQETRGIKHPAVDPKTQRAIYKNPKGGHDGVNHGGRKHA